MTRAVIQNNFSICSQFLEKETVEGNETIEETQDTYINTEHIKEKK